MIDKIKESLSVKRVVVLVVALMALIALGIFFFDLGYTAGSPSKDANKTSLYQYICLHDWKPSGYCASCGLKCPHTEWNKETHACTLCGAKCQHDEKWVSGVCEICGYKCEHEEWDNGRCVTCHGRCPHKNWENGTCLLCGMTCDHAEWENGICTNCGYVCEHEEHDKDTLLCTVCGEKCYHNYENGKCACGAEPDIVNTALSADLFAEIDNKGEIKELTYTVVVDGEETEKPMEVYLPYGYTDGQKYPVAIMLHGGGDDCTTWISAAHEVTGVSGQVTFASLYDNMIDRHIIQPTIIVGINTSGETDSLTEELRETVLPFIVDTFSTYAASSSSEDISAARQYFALGGNSNGALYTIGSGILPNYDLFGTYILMSGNHNTTGVAAAFSDGIDSGLPLYCFFNVTGQKDTQRNNVSNGFDQALVANGKIIEGENAFLVSTTAGHDFTTWTTGMYDALQLAFQDVGISDESEDIATGEVSDPA